MGPFLFGLRLKPFFSIGRCLITYLVVWEATHFQFFIAITEQTDVVISVHHLMFWQQWLWRDISYGILRCVVLLKMEATCSSEMSIDFQLTTQRCISEYEISLVLHQLLSDKQNNVTNLNNGNVIIICEFEDLKSYICEYDRFICSQHTRRLCNIKVKMSICKIKKGNNFFSV
jgi:hypothetical protein